MSVAATFRYPRAGRRTPPPPARRRLLAACPPPARHLRVSCPLLPPAPWSRAPADTLRCRSPRLLIHWHRRALCAVGAFVTIKEGVDGLVHISQIQDGGVGKVEDVLSVGQEVQVRVTSVDKGKRRIALSMRAFVERSEEEESGGRRGGGGFGGDLGFGDADAAFQMNAEELAELSVGDDFSSPFEIALERASVVAAKKAAKERYAQPTL